MRTLNNLLISVTRVTYSTFLDIKENGPADIWREKARLTGQTVQ
jgi:hypothetical protein